MIAGKSFHHFPKGTKVHEGKSLTARRPTIGVFDSGFGGLTVLKALLEVVPAADYLYFGDTARLPYGSKSVETVARYAVEAAHYLESHGAELLVIACNTATALALDQITAAAHVPVVGWLSQGRRRRPRSAGNKKEVVVVGTGGYHRQPRVSARRWRRGGWRRGRRLVPCWCRWWKRDGWNTR